MNVEGDFRYVDSARFDECNDFLEYINGSAGDWEETFNSWVDVSERCKEDQTMSKSYWGPWNLLKKPFPVFLDSVGFSHDDVLIQKPKVGG
ncbi:hypothetical protein JHK86_024809 [Glycine max]|nr:hypothetical protein JHK86_024809 [Glycine max]